VDFLYAAFPFAVNGPRHGGISLAVQESQKRVQLIRVMFHIFGERFTEHVHRGGGAGLAERAGFASVPVRRRHKTSHPRTSGAYCS
jgi:hypothetical protein